MAIPIEIPLPTAGMGPALALAYNSSAGNGVAGIGFDISGLDSIIRDPSFAIRFQGADHYRSVQGELIDVGGGQYRNRIDNGTIYYPSGLCGDGPCTWKAIRPDGTAAFYGENPDAAAQGPQADSGNVSEWALTRVQDRRGNYWTVQYDLQEGTLYPSKILYTMNAGVSLAQRSVQFGYENRPDALTGYNKGHRARMSRRLVSISTSGSSSYSLEYSQLNPGGRSVLVRLNHTGLTGASYSPLLFVRTDDTTAFVARTTGPTDPGQGPFDPNVCQLGIDACANTWYGANPIAAALCAIFVLPNFSIGTSASIACTTGDSQNVADVNGDGKADFVRATGFQRDVQQVTMLNEASGMGDTVSGLQYAGDSAAILGLEWQIVTDGNGNQTAVLTGAAAPSFDRTAYDHAIASKPYFSNQPNFGAGRTHFAAGSYAISIPYVPAGAQRYYVDVNGDGRSDFVRYQGGNWLVSLSNGSGFSPPTLWNAPQGSGIKPFRMWADFNGDGKADLIRLLDNGRISVALSNGAGFASDVITALDGAGVSPQLADVDGDGNLDFVRFKPNQLLFNRGKPGGSFESGTIIQTIDTGYDDFQYMVDVNGDGLADYVRILGGNRETLAVSFSNGQGFVDTTYSSIPAGPASSTRPALADMNGDGHPDFVCFQPGGTGFVPV
ncbi:MAG TPA: FG-GAP-like repeat-containing protein, partial [Leptospiraceae bacterium]|nr:FG-GAP-like repeat-containing protein [Leptospiraceae bacterium]